LDESNSLDESINSNQNNLYAEIDDKKFQHINKKNIFNIKNIIKIPIYLELIDNHIDYLPENLIQEFNINKNNKYSNISKSVVISFLNIKYVFTKLFYNNNKLLINNLYDFIKVYKNIIRNKYDLNYKINICLSFYNNTQDSRGKNRHMLPNKQYFYIKNKTLIKIDDYQQYELIYKNLKKNNIFLIQNKNKLILSYGEYLNFTFDKNDIPKLFNNKILSDGDYKKLFEYTNLTIFYWVSTKVSECYAL
jgi:hypothetical protein